jgi:hypothetical protein
VQYERVHLQPADPAGIELGPERHKNHDRRLWSLLDGVIQQLEARRIDPLRIFDDHQDRLAARERFDLPPNRFQRPLLSLLRREIEPRRAPIDIGQGEQLGDERGVFGRGRSMRKQSLKLVELRGGIVFALERRGAPELGDDRMKRTVRVVWRTEISQAPVRPDGNLLVQRGGQARLSDARLARKQDDATLAALRPSPVLQQQLELLVTAHQRRDAGLMQRLESALRRAETDHLHSPQGLGKALERHRAEIAIVEEPAGEATGVRLDHHGVGLGELLQARSEIGGFTDNFVLLGHALADEVAHDHQPGGDADPDLRCDARGPAAFVQPVQQRQTGANGALGIMFLRPRIPEIDQHRVTHVLGDEPAEPSDGFSDVCLIGDDHFAQILRVEPDREGGRADEVAEHDREMPALGRGGRRWRDGRQHGAAIRADLR